MRKKALVASSEGLWVDRYGFIPWSMVDGIVETKVSGESMVAIVLNDITRIKKQAYLIGKIAFWTGYRNIYITHLEEDNKTVAKKLNDFYEKIFLKGI